MLCYITNIAVAPPLFALCQKFNTFMAEFVYIRGIYYMMCFCKSEAFPFSIVKVHLFIS